MQRTRSAKGCFFIPWSKRRCYAPIRIRRIFSKNVSSFSTESKWKIKWNGKGGPSQDECDIPSGGIPKKRGVFSNVKKCNTQPRKNEKWEGSLCDDFNRAGRPLLHILLLFAFFPLISISHFRRGWGEERKQQTNKQEITNLAPLRALTDIPRVRACGGLCRRNHLLQREKQEEHWSCYPSTRLLCCALRASKIVSMPSSFEYWATWQLFFFYLLPPNWSCFFPSRFTFFPPFHFLIFYF